MTFRLLTCFSALLAALSGLAGVSLGANLTGRVRIDTERKGTTFEGVAVWLAPLQGRAPAPPPQVHRVIQKGKRFSPHVSVIGVGSTVDWPNLDPIFHNAFSNFAGQPFDTGLYPPGGTQRVRFQREGVVRVFCNIHSTMSAVIVVAPSPWFAATRPDGSFSITDVPPGNYVMRVWHERATDATLRALDRRVTVETDGSVSLEPVSISESGYVSAPHKNKYGVEYSPEPPARAGYETPAAAGGRRR